MEQLTTFYASQDLGCDNILSEEESTSYGRRVKSENTV